jgi:hypothetical protein
LFSASGVKVLAISIDAGGAKEVNPFLQAHQYTVPVLLDRSMDLYSRLGFFGVPATVVVDRQGNILGQSTGPINLDNRDFRRFIEGLSQSGRPD